MKAIGGILLAALFLALSARADTLYTLSGTATIPGNDACSGPCLETVNFTFDVTESLDTTYNEYFLTLTGASATAQGPLGAFSEALPISLDQGWYIPVLLGHSELDLNLGASGFMGNFEDQPFVPGLFGATLYSCGD